MTEAITLSEFKQDYDWRCAFQEALNGEYIWGKEEKENHPIENVTKVYFASVGENDQADWLAVAGWCEPKQYRGWSTEERLIESDRIEELGDLPLAEKLRNCFVVMVAGCDYTGWD